MVKVVAVNLQPSAAHTLPVVRGRWRPSRQARPQRSRRGPMPADSAVMPDPQPPPGAQDEAVPSRTPASPRKIELTINLPSWPARVPRLPALRRPPRKALLAAAGTLAVLALSAGLMHYRGNSGASVSELEPVSEAPVFEVVKPPAEQIVDADKGLKYDGRRGVASYNATYSGTRLVVSQQALPEAFAADPGALKSLAGKLSAKKEIKTPDGPLFIAADTKGKDQTAVFAKGEALIFMHADKALSDEAWIAFIGLLK